MISIEFQDVNELKNMSVSTDLDIKEISEMIRADIENNLKNEKSFDKTEIAPLKLSTIKAKRRKGQPIHVFNATGKLLNSVTKRVLKKDEGEIFIKGDRARIMFWLQEGKSPLAGTRRAFGISEEILNKLETFLEKIKIVFGR